MRTRTRWLRRLAAAMLGLILALLILEVGLRGSGMDPAQFNPLSGFHRPHPELGWIGVPDYRARFVRAEFDVIVETDERGFRRAGRHSERDPGARAVAFVGDSFTWGWGVEQGEVFTDFLQEAAGTSLHVRNYGVNAYGTAQQRILLDEYVLPDAPSVVVVMFFDNDLVDNRDEKGGRRPWCSMQGERLVLQNCPVRRELSGVGRALSRRVLALSWLRFQVNASKQRLEDAFAEPEAGGPERHSQSVVVDETAWKIQTALLEEMSAACASAVPAAELRVVYVPRRHELDANDVGAIRARLGQVCGELGIAYLDLTEGFRAEGEAEALLYFPHDEHWTSKGHRLAARLIHAAWW